MSYFHESSLQLIRLIKKVLDNLGNVLCSHETARILKEEIQFLREDTKNKSIIVQNLLENENILLRRKNKRNIQYNVDVNNDKIDFSSDEIFIPCSKTFKKSKNTTRNVETNNVKLTNSFQA